MYILAGLAIIALSTLIPARRDLHELRLQQAELLAKEQYTLDRLAAYAGFIDQWDQADQTLLVRLASTQLNRRPEGDRPIVLATNSSSTVTDWIEAAVDYSPPKPQQWPDSILSRLTAGDGQLWLLAGGTLAVFIGLVLTPTGATASALEDEFDDADAECSEADGVEALEPVSAIVGVDATASRESPHDGNTADLEAFGVEGNDQYTFWPDDETDDESNREHLAGDDGERAGTQVGRANSERAETAPAHTPMTDASAGETTGANDDATAEPRDEVDSRAEVDAGAEQESGPAVVSIARNDDDDDADEEDEDDQWEDEQEDDEEWEDDEDGDYEDDEQEYEDEEPDDDEDDEQWEEGEDDDDDEYEYEYEYEDEDEDDEEEGEEGDDEQWEDDEDGDDDLFVDGDEEDEQWDEEEDEDEDED